MTTSLLFLTVLTAGQNPYGYESKADARARRAQREAVVARVGDESRSLIETYDEAVGALSNCTVAVAKKLCEFHNEGKLSRLPRPRDFLVMLCRLRPCADDAALWAIQNPEKLLDVDAFDAYVRGDPLEFALGLRSITDGGTVWRNMRLQAQSAQAAPAPSGAPAYLSSREVLICLASVAFGCALMFYKRRKTYIIAPPRGQ